MITSLFTGLPAAPADGHELAVEVADPLVWLRGADGRATGVELPALRLEHVAGSLPFRRLRSRRGQRHLPGSYWSATVGRHVGYESQLELARLLLADFDPAVADIREQPFRLTAMVGRRLRSHVPDFVLVSQTSAVTVVNVKPADRLSDAAVAQRLVWPGRLLADHGWGYEVWTGCSPILLANVRFLAGYRRCIVVSDRDAAAAAEAVVDGEQLAVAERRLAQGRAPHTMRPALLAALWRGLLHTDLSLPLSGASVLTRAPS